MPLVTEFTIHKLNGRDDITIRLRGDHCILVGPNGTGKSTALQILAYALGRQWKGLGSLRFDALDIVFSDGKVATLSRSACLNFSRPAPAGSRMTRAEQTLTELDVFETFLAADLNNSVFSEQFSSLLRLSRSDTQMLQRRMRASGGDKASQKQVLDFVAMLKEQAVPTVLYLPTYRRIELELTKVLGDVPDYYRMQAAGHVKTGIATEFLVELVKFGMEDITAAIQSFERQTRDFARNRFNRMMTSYLKEMANSNVLSVGDLRSRHIDARTIEMVLSRIEEGLLSTTEKQQISDIILDLSAGPGAGNQPFNKKWLAHFFVRLMEVNTDIEDRESAVRNLVKSLDKYFYPKSVSYDIESYHFAIKEMSGDELKLSDLSSGEKQLVSILSQLHLQSSGKKFIVLVDEPELSLSVPWQSDLLPDITATSACKQLFAVTHSPFVYDNSLSGMVVDFAPVLER